MVLGLAFEKGFIQKTGTKVFYDGFFVPASTSYPGLSQNPALNSHERTAEAQHVPYWSRARYAITQFCIADVFDPDGKSSLCKI